MTRKRFQYQEAVVERIAELVGTGSSGVLEFANIPQYYRDLELILCGRSTAAIAVDAGQMTFETSPTSGAYNTQRYYGFGSSSGADEVIGIESWIRTVGFPGALSPANLSRTLHAFIPDYARTDMFKHVGAYDAGGEGASPLATNGLVIAYVNGLWESTAAIDRIRVLLTTGNWTTSTRAVLYGIR